MADPGDNDPAGAKSRYDEDEFELGYRVANPDAPITEPRILEALNPKFQAEAEKIMLGLRDKWLQQDRDGQTTEKL